MLYDVLPVSCFIVTNVRTTCEVGSTRQRTRGERLTTYNVNIAEIQNQRSSGTNRRGTDSCPSTWAEVVTSDDEIMTFANEIVYNHVVWI